MADPFARAVVLQQDAAAEGFDWDDIAGLWDKLQEEIAELREAADPVHRLEEIGDVLFTVVNLARHMRLDAALALSLTNAKFERRYAHVRAQLHALPAMSDPQRIVHMEALWQEAKQLEEKSGTIDSDK